MRRGQVRRATGRRGVTLLEMLVVVALVVLMMLILASIFQAATGAMTTMRTFQELDDSLRLLDLTIRQDLTGTTATMTPPNNPQNKSGYFEYGENAPADAQGEDTDDYIAFTTKAPEGRVFTGRIWVPFNYGANGAGTPAGPPAPVPNFALQPVTVSSQYAEILYFLRNGNLYRRVLLVMPERRGAIAVSGVAAAGIFPAGPGQFFANIYSPSFNPGVTGVVPVAWPGVNDISARPNDGQDTGTTAQYMPVPNDLGDLTNRENRIFRQRCARDFVDVIGLNGNAPGAAGRDGLLDDLNFDLLPDYYPTLTWTQVAAAASGSATTSGGTPTLINENAVTRFTPPGLANDLYAFPFIYPGMYSKPETASLDGKQTVPTGWLHGIDPAANAGIVTVGTVKQPANQAPLEYGDSLAAPSAGQTWWGFPTFRETASIQWKDPVYFPGVTGAVTSAQGQQVRGLQSFDPTVTPTLTSSNFMPPLGSLPPLGIPSAPNYPYDSDKAGYTGASPAPFVTLTSGITVSQATTAEQLSYVWDDDLIMTGVRSFDVKALDLNAPTYSIATAAASKVYSSGYYDLGYAASDYVRYFGVSGLVTGTPLLLQTTPTITTPLFDGNLNPIGFGHEGRMPPNSTDNRADPQRPFINPTVANPTGFNNIGDDSSGLNRLRRVWDSWSTDYTNAPAVSGTPDVDPADATKAITRGASFTRAPFDRPVYPSYPPPYPQALRGLQIQIRVVDPKNEKVKVLTIRQDFSDKL